MDIKTKKVNTIINLENSKSLPAKPHKQKIFFPNLDGLRFLCFLSVFFYHAFASKIPEILNNPIYKFFESKVFGNGELGVNFFFVLSGFLITFLLLVEKSKFGGINIGGFYMRRILRIWPLFYLCVIFGFIAFPILKEYFGQLTSENAHWWYYVLFINNIDIIKNAALPDSASLSVLWSVAVEEQFYLIWPLVLTYIPARFYSLVFVSIILYSFVFRLFHVGTFGFGLYTISNISDMAIGALAALLVFKYGVFKRYFENLSKIKIALIYISLFILFFFKQYIFEGNVFTVALERLVASMIFVLIILEQNYSKHSFFKMSNFRLISKLGTYTYGLYCLHIIAMLIVGTLMNLLKLNTNIFEVLVVETFLSLMLSIGLAYVSYHILEVKFLGFKDRFARITKS